MRAGQEPGEGIAVGRMPDSQSAGDGWGLMARGWDVPGYTEVKVLGSGGFGEVVLASLHDPNVVRLYEYMESLAGAAIVMELIDGVSLRDILSRHGQTTPEAALVVLQGSLLGLARPTRTSPTGPKTRSRTDAARTTGPIPATRP